MRSIAKLSTKLSIAGLAILLSTTSCFANALSKIEVNPENDSYAITLTTDEAAQMKKIVSSDDKMTIQLKDVEASSDLNTIYNNVYDIENITVAPSGKSDIKIVFKGKDVAQSKIHFTTPDQVFAQPQTATQSININAPMSSYTPVYTPQYFEETEVVAQTSSPEINEILTKLNISRETLVLAKKYAKKVINKTKSGDINLVTIMGVIFILAALIFRPKKETKKVKKQQTLSSMLSKQETSSQLDREIALNRRLAENMPLSRPDGLASINSVQSGYGIKAYQNSQRNPYTTNYESTGVSGIPRRKPLETTTIPVKKQTVSNQPITQNPIKAKRPSKIGTTAQASLPVNNNTELDSMKFLESITKIYEKNGRTDLAKGLKENLRKAQLTAGVGTKSL